MKDLKDVHVPISHMHTTSAQSFKATGLAIIDENHSPFHSLPYSPDLNVVTLSVLANVLIPHLVTIFHHEERIVHRGESGKLQG